MEHKKYPCSGRILLLSPAGSAGDRTSVPYTPGREDITSDGRVEPSHHAPEALRPPAEEPDDGEEHQQHQHDHGDRDLTGQDSPDDGEQTGHQLAEHGDEQGSVVEPVVDPVRGQHAGEEQDERREDHDDGRPAGQAGDPARGGDQADEDGAEPQGASGVVLIGDPVAEHDRGDDADDRSPQGDEGDGVHHSSPPSWAPWFRP